ncbi:MAG: hypothetical protein Q9160_007775 [Pyrenula sp. 1 TL-2023]
MSCIWSTSLELTWGAIAIRKVIQNMHIWSSRILKPNIAAAIRHVNEKLEDTMPLASRTPGSGRRPIASLPTTPSPLYRTRERDHIGSPITVGSQANEPGIKDNGALDDDTADAGGEEDDVGKRGNDGNKQSYKGSNGTDNRGDNTVDEYTVEDSEDKMGLALTLLPGIKFAKLSSIDAWFEQLSSEQRIEVVWKLINPSNGGLLQSLPVHKNRLQKLLDTLNQAGDEGKSDKIVLTDLTITMKMAEVAIRPRLRNLELKHLKVCFRLCLRLHDDRTNSIHKIIADDLATLSSEDREQMEKQAFEFLNSGDLQIDLTS